MSHEIWSRWFYARQRNHANGQRWTPWHELGTLGTEDETAEAVYNRMGRYVVSLEPLDCPTYPGIDVPAKAIIRHAAPGLGENEPEFFGTVSDKYHLITPDETVGLWDKYMRDTDDRILPVETMGVLRRGRDLFITAIMPDIGLRGSSTVAVDEIKNYLVMHNSMDGSGAAQAFVASTRVVCWNTLNAADGQARSRIRVNHYADSDVRLGEWMRDLYRGALEAIQARLEAYEVLATRRASERQMQLMAEELYPMPTMPNPDHAYVHGYQAALGVWEVQMGAIERRRETVQKLFAGEGWGSNLVTAAGTWWGAFNAVAEVETFARTSNMDSCAASLLNGQRQRTIQKAYNWSMTMAKDAEPV